MPAIMIGDPLIEVYKLNTPEGPHFAPKWLRNYRGPSKDWRPNMVTPTNGRIVKVDSVGFEDNAEVRMLVPVVHAVDGGGEFIHAVYLICTPEGLQSAHSKISIDLYKKMPEMEIVGL